MSAVRRIDSGCPEPPGVTLVAGGVNVAVFSANATAIELCLFDVRGESEVERIALPERTGDVFHGFVAGIGSGQRYGLRAHGPYDPRHGHRFNPAKLLVDPYARALDRQLRVASVDVRRISGRHDAQRRRQRTVRAEGGRAVRNRTRSDPPTAHAVGTHHRLRTARARIHEDPSRNPGDVARDLCRPRPSGGARAPDAAGHHDGRAHARHRG